MSKTLFSWRFYIKERKRMNKDILETLMASWWTTYIKMHEMITNASIVFISGVA
jgi:hypothetical protein